MPDKKEIFKKPLFKKEASRTEEEAGKEASKEKKMEAGLNKLEEEVALEEKAAKEAVVPVAPAAVSPAKSPELRQIEDILAEDLEDAYLSMPPQKRAEFKAKGEETAGKIVKLLEAAKINLRKIVKLIKVWLKMIPGINKYFLEQESKIKADRIMEMRK